jgi:four helix bundle protein
LSDELALLVYKVTRDFPKEEIWGLTSQMRRAAISVPANIAEGAARNHKREYLQFLYTAMGSLTELGYYIDFSGRIGYMNNKERESLSDLHLRTSKTLRALIHYIEKPEV